MAEYVDSPPIYRLPNEIIARIFENTALTGSRRDALASSKDVVRLSHVSSRFRSVAVGCPQLWCVVSSTQRKELRKVFLARSKAVELYVFLLLLPDMGDVDFAGFLEDVLPHSTRWKEFYFRTGMLLSDYIRILQKLSRICSGLILPSLTDLTLVFPDPTFYDTDGDGLEECWAYDRDSERFHFYKTWATPQLRRLHARNRIPLGTGSLRLENCEVKLRSSCGFDWSAVELQSLARTFASLKTLTFSAGNYMSDGHVPPLHLPMLENLSLDLHRHDYEGFISFMEALFIPNVRMLSFSIAPCRLIGVGDGCVSVDDSINALLPIRGERRYLQFLSICVGETDAHEDQAPQIPNSDKIFGTIFRSFTLHHLVLDIPDLRSTLTNSPFVPPLRTLTLRNNRHIGINSLSYFIGRLQLGTEWDAFESLTIDNCVNLEKQELVSLLPERKINWIPRPDEQTDVDPEATDSEPEYDYWSRNTAERRDDISSGLFNV